MKPPALFFALALVVTHSYAQERVVMPGPAVYKCTHWLDAKEGGARSGLALWVLGFVSGSNFRSANSGSQAKVPDNMSALAFADKYCLENPQQTLDQLSVALVENFGGPKSKHALNQR